MTDTSLRPLDGLIGPGSPVTTCWVDGRWTTIDRTGITLALQALHYGTGVFEGIRSYWSDADGVAHVVRLDDHVNRFLDGCRLLRIDPGLAQPELRDVVTTLVARSEVRGDLYIRPLALKSRLAPATPFGVGLAGVQDLVAVYAVPMPSRKTLTSLRCGVSSWRRLPSDAVPPQAKITGSYVNVALAVDEAREAGYDDAILLNTRGGVAEASTSNVFALRDGVLTTPSRDSDILPGITRDCVLALAQDLPGVRAREAPLLLPDLLAAQEVFLSGTGCELVAVTAIAGRPIGTGLPGPVTTSLFDTYRAVVRGATRTHAAWTTAVPIADTVHDSGDL